MLRCFIVDDEELAQKVIQNHCRQVAELEVAGIFSNALDAFSALQNEKVDLLFLDIEMPQMSGLQLIKALAQPPAVILTTAHRHFAPESYDLEVADYLLKPISLERFLRSVGKVLNKNGAVLPTAESSILDEPPFIVVKSERQFVKIRLDEIQYIESLKNHVQIVTDRGKRITLVPISEMENRLPPPRFVRVHRSFIVPIGRVEAFSHSHVTIAGHDLPIGEAYKDAVLQRLGG